VTLHLFSQVSMFIYSSYGKWVFPPSCGVFLPPLLLQAFLLLVTGHVPSPLPSPARFLCLQLTWEMVHTPSPVEFSSHCHFYKLPAPDCWAVLLFLLASVFVYSLSGRWVFSPLLWSFPPSTTLTSIPAPGCWVHAPAPSGASLARPSLFIYSSGKDSPQPPSALRAPHPLSHVSLLFLLLITQFLFFPWVEVSLSMGLCCSGPGLSVGELHTT
jgi:hypothetical protein